MIENTGTITDEFMKQMISKTRNYCIVLLKHSPNWNMAGAEKIIWEHGRRNFALKMSGALPIVCPVSDGSELSGIGIFNTNADELKIIMDEDPGVKEGIFIYEIHPCRSFPGSSLPLQVEKHHKRNSVPLPFLFVIYYFAFINEALNSFWR